MFNGQLHYYDISFKYPYKKQYIILLLVAVYILYTPVF